MLGISQSTLKGHQSVSGLKGKENWGLVGKTGLDQGRRTINSVFL